MKTKLILGTVTIAMLLFSGCTASNENVNTSKASYLSDKSGMTLYTFDKDTKNKSNCYNGCEAKWPVLYTDASSLNLPNGINLDDFGTITRNNGAKQTTYKSQPLYYFFKDTNVNDKKGDGVKGVWHIIK
ncbi:MAG: hypothetical protein K8R39_08705 [Arcobacteraceae bacterium]|nr:hypothetical protein [Arcobacteraceae bacterium]